MVDFEKNTPLVYYIYEKYFKHSYRYKEDLIQCGMLGLWKACKNFDESCGCRFSTFASICIRTEMGMFMRKQRKFDENVVDHITKKSNGVEIDMLDFVEDNSQKGTDEQIHIKNYLSRTKVLKEIVKGKTMKEVAKEKEKSIGYVGNTYMREKRYLEEICKF